MINRCSKSDIYSRADWRYNRFRVYNISPKSFKTSLSVRIQLRKQTKQAPAHKQTNAEFLSNLVNCLSCKLASVRFAQCRINEGF